LLESPKNSELSNELEKILLTKTNLNQETNVKNFSIEETNMVEEKHEDEKINDEIMKEILEKKEKQEISAPEKEKNELIQQLIGKQDEEEDVDNDVDDYISKLENQ
jgi:hypothetical protein